MATPGIGALHLNNIRRPLEVDPNDPLCSNNTEIRGRDTSAARVRDVEKTLTFYVDKLGFHLGWKWGYAPHSCERLA